MTLNEIAETVGTDVGFKFTSTTTGKEFTSGGKTLNGKFVISRPGKDAVVDGDTDRYEVVMDRTAEINLGLKKIEARREAICLEIDALNAKEDTLVAELDTLNV